MQAKYRILRGCFAQFALSPKICLSIVRTGLTTANPQNCAANIVHFPSAAQVILVDPTVNSGRQFIRDWSKDAGKIVLEYLWVTRCMNAGRALLAEDDWGGSIAVDDGKPISTSEDMNDPALQRQWVFHSRF